jgi:hypothetical protein
MRLCGNDGWDFVQTDGERERYRTSIDDERIQGE